MADQGRIVKMWFSKSVEDLRAAQLLMSQNSESFWGPSVFHSQQSAEKALKGFLAFNKIRFSKTHDLEILINLLSQVDTDLAEKLKPAILLTKFATAYRYPEEAESPEPMTQIICEKIYAIANMVCEEIKSKAPLKK